MKPESSAQDQMPRANYDVRRSELKYEARRYSDGLHARLLEIYKKYGATDAEGMRANVLARKGHKLEMNDVMEIDKLLDRLDRVLTLKELPPGYVERPSLKDLEGLVNGLEATGNRKVISLRDWDDWELKDGKPNGAVTLNNSWECPIIDGELIETMDGVPIQSCGEVINHDGKLCGRLGLTDGRLVVVFDGEIITKVGDVKVGWMYNFHIVDGQVNGRVTIQDDREVPMINGELIEELDGRRILKCLDVRNVDGKLNGAVTFDGINYLPVIDGVLVPGFEGLSQPITVRDVQNVDGKLNCSVFSADERNRKVHNFSHVIIDGEPFDYIGGHVIVNCGYLRNIDGKLNGMVTVKDGRKLPVIDGEVIEEIGGKRIFDCAQFSNVDGKLNGVIKLEDKGVLPVVAGELVDMFPGRKIINILDFSCAGGVFSGRLEFDGSWGSRERRIVLLGKLLQGKW